MKLDTLKWHMLKVDGKAEGMRIELSHKALTKLCRDVLKKLATDKG